VDYYSRQRSEQRQELIRQIEHGFKSLLSNPEMDSRVRPDVKKVYKLFRKVQRHIQVDNDD
jgi:plasmid stabilization system protein ParE